MRSPTMTLCSGLVVFAAAFALPGPAKAADSDAGNPVVQAIATTTTDVQPAAAPQATPPPRQVDRIGPALDGDALDALRGGTSSIDSEVHNHGEVDGNTADGVVSGSNIIEEGAFANINGISTVIQNSGSNVLIQNGTAVNVQFLDPTP